MVHDFIATPRYLVFFVSPLRLKLIPFLAGLKRFSESLEWKPELGTEVIVVPIVSPDAPIRFQTEAFFQWHFANAFEKGEELVVDFIRYPNFDSNQWLSEILRGKTSRPSDATFYRANLNLRSRSARFEKRLDRACEFPRVSPRAMSKPSRYTYVALHSPENGSRGLPDRLGRLDVEKGTVEEINLGAEQYLSEPLFVPSNRSHENDDGFLLTLAYDAKTDRSYLAVIDARDPQMGAVGKAWFDHAIPFTFHGSFAAR
jgi:all-trans-8'-apo-beta-carotenal 15,15'-oxygenase